MWLTIMRQEWKILVADRTAWFVIGVFALTIGYAALNGARHLRQHRQGLDRFLAAQEAHTDKLQKRASAMERYLTSGNAVANLPRYERYEYDFGPLDARYASAINVLSASCPPPALASISIGLSDLYPVAHTVSWWNTELVSTAEPTESPLKLLTGNFDMAFVILYLFPLFILALCFNLIAAEKEGGNLNMLLAQGITLRTLLAGKLVSRVLLILVPVLVFTALGALLSGITINSIATATRLLGWMLIAVIYGAFWFGLAVLVNGFGKSAAVNAMILVVCWLALVLLIPTVASRLATTLHPVPSRAEFIDAKREIPLAVEQMDQEILKQRFFRDHPEFASDGPYTDWGRYGIMTVAKEEEVGRRLEDTRRRFDEQLAKQERIVNTLGYVSPSILAQRALYDFAGTGAARHQNYLSQANRYNLKWKTHFWPAMFTGAPFSAAEYDRIPRFEYTEESLSVVIRRAITPMTALLVLASVLGALGIRAYRRYPIVG